MSKISESIAQMLGTDTTTTAAATGTEPRIATDSGPLSGQELRSLAEELSRINEQKKEIDERIAQIKARLLADPNLTTGTKIADKEGKPIAAIRIGGTRFDPVQAAQVLPDALLDMVSVKQPDGKVAKAKLPPEMYKQCLKQGRPTVVVL